MLKAPLDYFAAQDFSVRPPTEGELTESEALFMRKYLGVGEIPLPSVLPIIDPITTVVPLAGLDSTATSDPRGLAEPEVIVSVAAQAETLTEPEDEEAALSRQEQVQFVGFYVGRQQYTLPTGMVREVLRTLPVSQLPMVSPFIRGVMNLRGRVLPLVRLGAMLGIADADDASAPFSIICHGRGLQVGLQIDRVHRMYRIAQRDIQWNVEASIGVNGDCISGLFLLDEQIVPIISAQRIVDMILGR